MELELKLQPELELERKLRMNSMLDDIKLDGATI
jgi:hypothetical protein